MQTCLACGEVHRRGIRTRDRVRETQDVRARFREVRFAEMKYSAQLRKIARMVGDIVRKIDPQPGDVSASMLLQSVLRRYSDALEPWARAVAAGMLKDVHRRDLRVWASLGNQMGRALSEEVEAAPTGEFLRAKLAENVSLITSLPIEAGERVHELTLEALKAGTRAKEIAADILRSGEVTVGRANLIARTEVARTASGLVEARSVHVGSEGYIWRTVGDSDVRREHRKLNGRFVRWDSPPIAGSRGERAHAGQIYNCRCFPDPVIPEES